MRWLAAFWLLIFTAPTPEIRYFQFERPVVKPAPSAGQTCAVVDPGVFAHALVGLADLRLYQSTTETPYVLRVAAPVASAGQSLSLLNVGKSGNQTVFDAAMPSGSYSDIQLNIDGRNFLATVAVSGSQTQTSVSRTKLGSFTIFDLTQQRLGRSTILHLPQSDFRFLHFQIAGLITPQNVTGLSVVEVPVVLPKYVTVTQTATGTQKGRDSVFEFTVPARTPVGRIVFVPGAQPSSFSRDVQVKVAPVARPPADDSTAPPQPFTFNGNILRVHSIQNGHRIDEEHLAVDAPSDLDSPTKWTVTIENGDDAPVQITSIRLEMMERDLCFDAAAGAAYTLYYGDSALAAPQYDYAALFVPADNAVATQLGAETANSAYQPRPDMRPFTEKHPALLWMALILVMMLLGAVAFRSVKAIQDKPS
ncbi:MAG: DUF3999 family protein [Terracidiphilus sp.]|nr:DUF3999 family protein [Terracidiphilus sp.]MDR3797177.1 DUF3999 family protein [Terracidiphilus sp.]